MEIEDRTCFSAIDQKPVFIRKAEFGRTDHEDNAARKNDYVLCCSDTMKIIAVITYDGLFDTNGNYFFDDI